MKVDFKSIGCPWKNCQCYECMRWRLNLLFRNQKDTTMLFGKWMDVRMSLKKNANNFSDWKYFGPRKKTMQ